MSCSGRKSSVIMDGANNKRRKRVGEVQDLLPGIPNEVTIKHIATKLHWTVFYVLSSVSRKWEATIKSREIFQARCSSQSTQTLFALQHKMGHFSYPSIWLQPGSNCLALYSPEDDSIYHLPPIPRFDLGAPSNCECVFLEGKLYAVGGDRLQLDCSNVHVFDLVGQGQWKPCASMKDDRQGFQCGVMNGKIYAFGGKETGEGNEYHRDDFDDPTEINAVIGCEVYDPEKDLWTPITSEGRILLHLAVMSMGEELVVYDGCNYLPDHGCCVDVYHPAKDQWRRIENFLPYESILAMIGGKLHSMTEFDTQVYDIDTNEWTPVQPFDTLVSYLDNPALDHSVDFSMMSFRSCAAVKNALFATVTRRINSRGLDTYLIRCQRSNGNNNEIKQEGRHCEDAQSEHQMIWDRWQRLDCSLLDKWDLFHNPLKCPVQL